MRRRGGSWWGNEKRFRGSRRGVGVITRSTTAVADGVCFRHGGMWFCDVNSCRGHCYIGGDWYVVM